MDGLRYRFDYASDPVLRRAFIEFLIAVHDLDLTLWDQRVGWDDDFVSFSFFDGDRVVASTSVYVLDMLVRDDWRRVAQLSSVGTLPPYRRRGLNAELTRRAKEWIATNAPGGTFFFADDDALAFYAKQGYTEKSEWRAVIGAPVSSLRRPAYRLVDYGTDEARVVRLVQDRAPVSSVLGVKSPKLELFHLLYENAGELRYVEDLEVLVACEIERECLMIYDVIGPEIPAWEELEPLLVDEGVRTVSFGFAVDRLDVRGARLVEERRNRLHVVSGEDLITDKVMVPATAHA